MNKLIEKIKHAFKDRKKPEPEPSKKPRLGSKPFTGTDEISKSIRDPEKSKLNKGLWRNVFR